MKTSTTRVSSLSIKDLKTKANLEIRKKEPKELKNTFKKLDIHKTDNGFIVYVNNSLHNVGVTNYTDECFVFNTLKDLASFLLTYKEID